MNLFELTERLAKRMKWYDFSLFKTSMVFFTLFIVTAWEGFRNWALGIEWYWHLIIGLILMAPVFKKMFCK